MTPHLDDTIVAVATAAGPGRRAVVRLSGPKAFAVAATLSWRASGESQTWEFGTTARRGIQPAHLHLPDFPAPVHADLYYFPGPHSYTGQDCLEFHVIGSPPIVERLVAGVLASGARAAGPGEFTLRAFLAGKKDLPQAEAVLAVIDAGTDADLQHALAQLAGGVSHPLQALRSDLLDLLADIEAGLDFVEEDIQFVSTDAILMRVAAGLAQLINVQRQLTDRGVSGRAVRVALVGEPNAGKSSLFNALAGGAKAIVSPVPGTTRDYLTAKATFGGVACELIDTAGWEAGSDGITTQAQKLGRGAAADADVLLWCVPATDELGPKPAGREVLSVRTKADTTAANPAGIPATVTTPDGTAAVTRELGRVLQSLVKPPLAPSLSRCRGHVSNALLALRRAHHHALNEDPPELLALAVREALEEIGATSGAVYTNDLLDRIFSRFCIGK